MAYKLDIFSTLDAIDDHDLTYLERQPEDARKGFAPPVVLRWASAASDSDTATALLLLVNATANVHYYDISAHPDLQYKLLASCGVGRVRHKWIAPPKSVRAPDKLIDFLGKYWPDAKPSELRFLLDQFDRPAFLDFVEGSGCTAAEIKELMNVYDRLHGLETEKAKGKKKAEGRTGN